MYNISTSWTGVIGRVPCRQYNVSELFVQDAAPISKIIASANGVIVAVNGDTEISSTDASASLPRLQLVAVAYSLSGLPQCASVRAISPIVCMLVGEWRGLAAVSLTFWHGPVFR